MVKSLIELREDVHITEVYSHVKNEQNWVVRSGKRGLMRPTIKFCCTMDKHILEDICKRHVI